ncbi:MAG: hypothetical protein ACLQU2_25175 [Candidatus Binataceae bacterium]
MASPLQRRLSDREDGLGSIVSQLAKVKRRRNLLATQQMAFSSLALLVGAGGLLVIAAFFLSPMRFLVLGVVLALLLIVALPVAVASAARRFAGLGRIAAIVDEKAELNRRLSTLLELAEQEPNYPLWPFLVEDTLGRLDDFHPQRIEKRRISRSIYGFAAACLIASLAGLMTYSARLHHEALRKMLKNFTLELDPSEIAPSDGGAGEGTPVEADPDTLRSLADRLDAANQINHNPSHGAINKLEKKATDLASSLQDKLTGRQFSDTPEKVKIKLAQALGDSPPPPEDNGTSANNSDSPKAGDQPHALGSNASGTSRKSNPAVQQPSDTEADSGSPDHHVTPPKTPMANSLENGGPEGPGTGDTPVPGQKDGTTPDDNGQTAGNGSDPEHLMGPPDAPSHKNDNFEIMIDARLSDRSPIASAQPYVPPKVKTTLSPYQHPDEPLDRGTVPAADRDTVRRVFER